MVKEKEIDQFKFFLSNHQNNQKLVARTTLEIYQFIEKNYLKNYLIF